MQKYLGVAEENEVLTKDEILTVLGITMTVGAGKNLMHFMQSLQTKQDEEQQDKNAEDCSPGCCD